MRLHIDTAMKRNDEPRAVSRSPPPVQSLGFKNANSRARADLKAVERTLIKEFFAGTDRLESDDVLRLVFLTGFAPNGWF